MSSRPCPPFYSERIAVLADLPREVRLGLAEAGELLEVRRGHVFYRAGDPATDVFAVVGGFVRSITPGQSIALDWFRAGDVFGEDALTSGHVRQAEAEARRPSLVLRLPKTALELAAARAPELHRSIAAHLAARLQRAGRRLTAIACGRAEQRLAVALLELADETEHGDLVVDRLTQEELAELAGVTRETAAHVLHELRAHGTLGKGLQVRAPDMLRLAGAGVESGPAALARYWRDVTGADLAQAIERLVRRLLRRPGDVALDAAAVERLLAPLRPRGEVGGRVPGPVTLDLAAALPTSKGRLGLLALRLALVTLDLPPDATGADADLAAGLLAATIVRNHAALGGAAPASVRRAAGALDLALLTEDRP